MEPSEPSWARKPSSLLTAEPKNVVQECGEDYELKAPSRNA
jgi:hypothetical protein